MFKSNNEFCLHLEKIKQENGFETYMQTLMHFYEYESDQEMEDIAKMLNRKVIDSLEREGISMKMIKHRQMETLI